MVPFFLQFARYITLDIFGSVIAFPVWWYGAGFVEVLRFVGQALAYRIKSYGFVLWIKSLFVPMYGQYDLAGRIVSVFMRLVVLIGRGLGLVVEAFVYTILLILWILAPVLVIFGIIWNSIS